MNITNEYTIGETVLKNGTHFGTILMNHKGIVDCFCDDKASEFFNQIVILKII
tara:strand:+ start:113 stop:271 length:159 start_codon:yes stop_codon:yes gene_type:complete